MRDIEVNEASKLIKTTLRAAFPSVKFSVRLSKYSMGCSIDAHWTDGPTGSQVNPILDRFNGKGFDGMTDMSYSCGKRTYKGESVNFHSGYVHGNRRYSRAFLGVIAVRVAQECGTATPEVDEWGCLRGNHNLLVPYQWYHHWIEGNAEVKYLTLADIKSSKLLLLASDRNGGEYLNRLIDRVAAHTSCCEALPVELPEYIPGEKEY